MLSALSPGLFGLSRLPHSQAVSSRQPVRFGSDLLGPLGSTLAQIAQQKKPEENAGRRGRMFRLALTNLIGIPALTMALSNMLAIETYVRQQLNQNHGTPLASMLDPLPEPPEEAQRIQKLITQLGQTDYIPASFLYEAAKAGLVTGVVMNSPTALDGRAILLDGREVITELNPDTRSKLALELNVPMWRPATAGINFSTVEAGLLALLLVNGLNTLLMLKQRKLRTLKRDLEELEKRQSANDMARFLVARKLGVTDEPLTQEEVSRLLKSPDFIFGQRPYTVAELEKRCVVALAGFVAEEKLYGDPSVVASLGHELVSEINRTIISRLGVREPFVGYTPISLNEEAKKQLEAAVKERVMGARQQVADLLNAYPVEGLHNLRQVFKTHKNLSMSEMEALLQGKPFREVRPGRIRRWISRLPIFNKRKLN